jgi:hypothetical protein
LRAPRESICVVEIKEAGVEDRIDLHTRGKVELEHHLALADDVEDLEWTEALVIKFSRGASRRNIPPRQPDKISHLEWRRLLDTDIVKLFVFGLGGGEVLLEQLMDSFEALDQPLGFVKGRLKLGGRSGD